MACFMGKDTDLFMCQSGFSAIHVSLVLVTGSRVGMDVKLPGEERQCCFVGAGKVIPETSSSVQTCFFQFNIDAFIDSSLKPSVFSVQNEDITVLRVSLFLQMEVPCWVWT